jgi:trehalose 6-phosphate synthase/phosphatase
VKCVVSVEGVKEFDTRWIGWAGVNVPDEVGQKALTKALAEMVLNIVLSWLKFVQI